MLGLLKGQIEILDTLSCLNFAFAIKSDGFLQVQAFSLSPLLPTAAHALPPLLQIRVPPLPGDLHLPDQAGAHHHLLLHLHLGAILP